MRPGERPSLSRRRRPGPERARTPAVPAWRTYASAHLQVSLLPSGGDLEMGISDRALLLRLVVVPGQRVQVRAEVLLDIGPDNPHDDARRSRVIGCLLRELAHD